MVGTFYSAPDPDSPQYVKVGDNVGPETVVCTVEAMKVFNQIPAEVSGKIVAVLVENGEPVEYGQPMFKVDTRQKAESNCLAPSQRRGTQGPGVRSVASEP
jgi:acetyl-CoA carboxylase biotin carboxyl carrier protein